MPADSAAALARKAAGLVENQHRGILMNNKALCKYPRPFRSLWGNRLWICGSSIHNFMNALNLRRQAYDLACGYPLTGLGAFAVESHLAGAQKLFERAVIVALDGHVRCAARRRCSD